MTGREATPGRTSQTAADRDGVDPSGPAHDYHLVASGGSVDVDERDTDGAGPTDLGLPDRAASGGETTMGA